MSGDVDVKGFVTTEASVAPQKCGEDGVGQPYRERLSQLYLEYHPQLVATLRKMYGEGPPDPEDVANEAFERVFGYDKISSVNNLRAFTWRVAKNIVLKVRRDNTNRSRRDFEVANIFFPEKSYESTPERIIEAREQLTAINDLLRKMPETRRRAFVLHRVEGLSITDTARTLGMSRPGAAKHIARAAAQINDLFDGDGEPGKIG